MEEIKEAVYLRFKGGTSDKVYVSQVVMDPSGAGRYFHLTAWGRRGYPLNTRRAGPLGLPEALQRHRDQVRSKERGGYWSAPAAVVLGNQDGGLQETLGIEPTQLSAAVSHEEITQQLAPKGRKIYDLDDEA